MTAREYALISPYLPGQPRLGRKRRTDLRAVLDAVFYVLQNGCPWANLPKDFRPKSTVYWYFRRFLEDGTWVRIHDALYGECRDLEDR
jgi:transposase